MHNDQGTDYLDGAPPGDGEDQLTKIRAKLERVRELELTVNDLEATVAAYKAELRQLLYAELPDDFAEAQISNLGLDASGNMPGYQSKLKPFYRANIAAEWDARSERERSRSSMRWRLETWSRPRSLLSWVVETWKQRRRSRRA